MATPIAVIARTGCATITNGFTDGKRYSLTRVYDSPARGGEVVNDNGHLRVVPLDGGKTAHFKRESTSVGGFDVEFADGSILGC